MTKVRPFLKWAGNKYHCLDNILKALPPGNRLIEPFTGSGAIFINSNYSNYLLAEKNKDLVNLFQSIQKEGPNFINYCADFFSLANNNAEQYYQFREQFNLSQDITFKAALFLYLNRHGYNGLCRYNQKGSYNVPFGRHIKPYFPHTEMNFFYKKSQFAEFTEDDFRQTFAKAKTGDVIYCDPPYVPLSASANFTSYTNKKFSEQDQIDLADLARKTAAQGVTVIISNHDTEFSRQIYRDSDMFSFPVKRFISCNKEKRLPAQELVAIFK